MKGVSCTQGGHNGEQLARMCLAISEDVHNSLMSKNNSNNNAAADCINNNKGDWVPCLDPAAHKRGAWPAGFGGDQKGVSACFLLWDNGALLRFRSLRKEPGWGSQKTWVPGLVPP